MTSGRGPACNSTSTLFEHEPSLRNDLCARKQRHLDNQYAASYTTLNLRDIPPGSTCVDHRCALGFAQKHPNLRGPWVGYGPDCRAVCGDSQLRYDPAQQSREPRAPQQLRSRVFQAVPMLQRGKVPSGLENQLRSGADTSAARACEAPTLELSFDVFHPSVSRALETSGHRIGLEPSRDTARSAAFLRSMGYHTDGRAWYRERAQ